MEREEQKKRDVSQERKRKEESLRRTGDNGAGVPVAVDFGPSAPPPEDGDNLNVTAEYANRIRRSTCRAKVRHGAVCAIRSKNPGSVVGIERTNRKLREDGIRNEWQSTRAHERGAFEKRKPSVLGGRLSGVGDD